MKKYTESFLFILLAVFLLAGGFFLFNKNERDDMFAPVPAEGGIVSLLPSATEILFELKVPGIVGVSTYCNWPEKVNYLKRVGDSFGADMEAILKLKPSVVYLSESSVDLENRLDYLGIPNIPLPDASNIQDIFDNIESIAYAENIDPAPLLSELQRYTAEKPAKKFKAFIEIDNGLWTTGGNTYLSELIEYAGAENIFKEVDAGYFQTSLEAVLKKSPDIIISIKTVNSQDDYMPKELRGKKIIRLNPDVYARPTPRAVRGAAELRELLEAAQDAL